MLKSEQEVERSDCVGIEKPILALKISDVFV